MGIPDRLQASAFFAAGCTHSGEHHTMQPSLYTADPRTPTARPSPLVIPGIESYLPHFSRALADEIAQIRKGGGQKTYVSDGRRLGTRDGRFIYSFTADTELRFPDDTPVDLEYHGRKHEGQILSIDGFDLILALIVDIGSDIPNAILHTEPWFLLQQLQERLYELRTSEEATKHWRHACSLHIPRPRPGSRSRRPNSSNRSAGSLMQHSNVTSSNSAP